MESKKYNSKDVIIFILYALFGIFMFFVPIEIAGAKTIPIDHITSFVKKIPNYNLTFGVFMVVAGIIYAIKSKSWQKSKLHSVFFVLKLVSLIFCFYVHYKQRTRKNIWRRYAPTYLEFHYGICNYNCSHWISLLSIFDRLWFNGIYWGIYGACYETIF